MLPPNAITMWEEGLVKDSSEYLFINANSKVVHIETALSSNLQQDLKKLNKKVKSVNIQDRFKVNINEKTNWSAFWCLKNPNLRAIRLKVAYKDIWSNERRNRILKTATDNKCQHCGDTETVFHQLFLCCNARRLWNIYNKLFQIKQEESDEYKIHLIGFNESLPKEFIKSLIFKTLIGIDRGRNLHQDQVISQWNKTIAIEQAFYEKHTLYSQAKWAVNLQQQLLNILSNST